jgi:hypothetical protein
MASRSERGGRLKGFRLADVPLDLRLGAARTVGRGSSGALSSVAKPTDRLFARLLDLGVHGDTGGVKEMEQVAKKPSARVYWVSLDAWERVVGPRAEP